MIGTVEILNLDNSVIERSNNLLVDGAGSLIVDILTANPGLSGISSASAILDASNYTIQAFSVGTGYDSYRKYAHDAGTSALALSLSGIVVRDIEGNDTSSYQTSDLDAKVMSPPSPLDTRIEQRSTQTPISYLDMGQHVNSIHFSGTNGLGISSLIVGAFPASAGTHYFKVDANDANIVSGTFRSLFNTSGTLDGSGFVNMIVSNASQGHVIGDAATAYHGLIVSALPDFSSTGDITYQVYLREGDLGGPLLYGGIYGLGLWYLDLKTLLSEGKTPPYSFSALNNQRRYKLFSKKIFTKDLAHHEDGDGSKVPSDRGGLASFEDLSLDAGYDQSVVAPLKNGIIVNWKIKV